jgi:hypothetical protein
MYLVATPSLRLRLEDIAAGLPAVRHNDVVNLADQRTWVLKDVFARQSHRSRTNGKRDNSVGVATLALYVPS